MTTSRGKVKKRKVKYKYTKRNLAGYQL